MYEKVSTSLSFVEREKQVLDFWKSNTIFEKSVEQKKGKPVFTFFDGPPTANGKPHIGHILTRAIKDIIPRYKTMKGYDVLRKAGWDTHGLPVELEVEKLLGISGKPDIEKYGVEPFIKKCKESVWKYESEWREMSDRVGYWADMEDPYVTYHNTYIESVWWSLKQIWDKGLLYKGHKVVPYCPRCGTALSSHEVAQGYKDVKEKSAFAKFKVTGKENEYFLAWTTTPWTLPSNVALVVNANAEYAKAKCGDCTMILAKALIETALAGEENVEILETCYGADLAGMEYEPLFPFSEKTETSHRILCDDYVTLTDGTGIVHTAPAFGEDDARIGRENNLPFVQLVDEQGNMSDITPWGGVFVKDADPLILKYLEEAGLLYKSELFEHNYPFCWRCDTPLLYYARHSWFIKTTAIREELLKNNDTVNWMPDNVKQGRFGKWLENVVDWGVSRERYWGTPLPIWQCECGHQHCVGSIAELQELGENIPDDIELHKPYIDDVVLHCPECGKVMKRVPEVIDCWYDSGAMPFAQWHYPFENKEIFEKHFPANFISEAIDQTRGWFYTLMAISSLIFEQSPYENVIVMGHVQDKNGQKMSKHKGNVVDPWEVLNKQGADAVRWYFYSASAPWTPNRFYDEAVNEVQRRFMGTLWNTYAFYVLYANIDNFNPCDYKLDTASLPAMDKWILSRLNSLIKFVDDGLNDYKITETARAIEEFVDDLSNWYVRRCRDRFWGSGMEQDKVNAYMTLYTVLESVVRLVAPYTPFMAESIYQNIVRGVNSDAPESVHLCDFPTYDESLIDPELETNMDLTLSVVIEGRAARNTANIKNRQPIGTMYVKAEAELPQMFCDIAAEELNIKNLVFTDDVSGYSSYSFKPQLRTLGPKYGKLLSKISAALKEVDGNAFMAMLNEGTAVLDIDGESVELALDDVLVETEQSEGFVSETGRNVTVVIDTNLTPELIEEGFVREVISKLQTMRKEADFEVMDKISVKYRGSAIVEGVIERNMDEIKSETLADELTKGEGGTLVKEWSINGEQATLSVTKETL